MDMERLRLETGYRLARNVGWLDRLAVGARQKALRSAGVIHALDLARDESVSQTARAVFTSLWQSHLLLRYAGRVRREVLWDFLDERVEQTHVDLVEESARHHSAIIATPHYGPFLPLCIYLIRRFDGVRKLNIMFNDPAKTPSNRQHEDLFRTLGRGVEFHYPDRKGTIAALKCLKRGELLALMPDVYFQSESIMAVPFFGRLLRVMPGTSFFSLKTDAPILPLYPVPTAHCGMQVRMSDAIRPQAFAGADDDAALFGITQAYMRDMQRDLTQRPHHWNYWDSFMMRSTAFLPDAQASDTARLGAEFERLQRALGHELASRTDMAVLMDDFAKQLARANARPTTVEEMA